METLARNGLTPPINSLTNLFIDPNKFKNDLNEVNWIQYLQETQTNHDFSRKNFFGLPLPTNNVLINLKVLDNKSYNDINKNRRKVKIKNFLV